MEVQEKQQDVQVDIHQQVELEHKEVVIFKQQLENI